MAYSAITTAEVASGKPVTTSLMNKVKDNLDDLDSRVASLGGNFIIFNELINYKALPQGTLIWSFETEGNFQSLFGTEWELVDSTSNSWTDEDGNTIATTDVTDRYLLNKGDGVEALRAQLASKTKAPDTDFNASGAHSHTMTIGTGSGAVVAIDTSASYTGTTAGDASGTSTGGAVTGGDSVNRPNSVVGNLFIKTQEETSTRRMVYKASSLMTLNTAKITQTIAGTSGTLEIDILKGSSLGSLTTVFSTKPSVVYSAGNYTTSSNAVISDAAVAVNDWIVLEIVSMQDTRSEFHIQIEAAATT